MDIINYFSLPYQDWYDTVGRIFKDVLIKNFNAIEEKINQLLSFDISNLIPVDNENIEIDDVTLESDDDSIINLKSFYTINNGIIDFPLRINTSSNTVISVSLIDKTYNYRTITPDEPITATSAQPFVYLNTNTYELSASSSFTDSSPYTLIAILKDNILYTGDSPIEYPINILKILSKQCNETVGVSVSFGNGYHTGTYSNQVVLIQNGQSKSSGRGTLNFIPYFLDLSKVERNGY